MTKFCVQCGTALSADSVFCDSCGNSQPMTSLEPEKRSWLKRFWFIPVLALLLIAGILVVVLILDQKPKDPLAWLGEYQRLDEVVDACGGEVYVHPLLGTTGYATKCEINGKEGMLGVEFDENEEITGYEFVCEIEDKDDAAEYFYELVDIYSDLYGEPIREIIGTALYGSEQRDYCHFVNEDDELLVTVRRDWGVKSWTVRISWYVPFVD